MNKGFYEEYDHEDVDDDGWARLTEAESKKFRKLTEDLDFMIRLYGFEEDSDGRDIMEDHFNSGNDIFTSVRSYFERNDGWEVEYIVEISYKHVDLDFTLFNPDRKPTYEINITKTGDILSHQMSLRKMVESDITPALEEFLLKDKP